MHSCCGRVFAEEASLDAHQTKVHPHPYRVPVTANVWRFERDLAEVVEYARQFTADQRKGAAKSGDAMSDGSFPIKSVQDLKNAIKAVGRASNPAKAKAHIKKRAKALGQDALIPSDWASIGIGGVQGAPSVIVDPQADQQSLPYSCDYCGRKFASEVAEKLHESLVHASQLPAGESQSGNAPKKTGEYGVPASKATNDTSAVSAAEAKKKNGQPQPSHLKNGSASNVNSSGGAGSGSGNSSANTTNPVTGAQESAADGGNGNGAGNGAAHVNRDVTHPQPTPQNDDEAALWPWILVDEADKPESFDDIRGVVSDALDDLQHNINPLTGEKYYVWVADISDSWVVFSRRGDYFKVDYTMDDNGAVTFTGPVQSVSRRTVYVADVDQDKDNTDGNAISNDDDDDAAVATGHKKKKNGQNQPSHMKMGRAMYVMGIGPSYYDPDHDGDVDTPGQPDADKVSGSVAAPAAS